MASLAEGGGKPLETLVEAISRGGAGGLNVPAAMSQAVKAELVGDFGSVHGVGKILLVGKDQENGVAELVLVEHALKLFAGLNDTVTIVAIDDKDDTLGVLEVVSPEGTDLVLTTDIPDGELNVLVLDGLDVEADGRDSSDNLTKLELVENGGFTGGIETDHENSHLLLPPQLIEQLGKSETHDCDFGDGAYDNTFSGKGGRELSCGFGGMI